MTFYLSEMTSFQISWLKKTKWTRILRHLATALNRLYTISILCNRWLLSLFGWRTHRRNNPFEAFKRIWYFLVVSLICNYCYLDYLEVESARSSFQFTLFPKICISSLTGFCGIVANLWLAGIPLPNLVVQCLSSSLFYPIYNFVIMSQKNYKRLFLFSSTVGLASLETLFNLWCFCCISLLCC